MIPPITAHHYALVQHVLAARPPRRGGAATTHQPIEIEDHSRLTTDTYFQAATETTNADEHVDYHAADLLALQYSQAFEDIAVNAATGGNAPVVLDGVNSIDSTLPHALQLQTLEAYSAEAAQHHENLVVHTYMHDEVAIEEARRNEHRIDSTM